MRNESSETRTAFLYSDTRPDKEQENRFLEFLKKKYGENVDLVWKKSGECPGGFRLVVDSDTYDWSLNGRLRQLKDQLFSVRASGDENVISLLKETLSEFEPSAVPQEVGKVLAVGDGIATLDGLRYITYGEIVRFPSGAKGMVMDLKKDRVGAIIFNEGEISEGDVASRTGKMAGMPVGEGFLGRVVDPLGTPIDGLGEIRTEKYYAIEKPAPGIIDRQPVNRPMETGILSIDSMFPIGRGQRELIIGDRQTGKTAIAVDTILNQKGKDVVCIYVAIGQKASSVVQLVDVLRKQGALEYSVVVCATASDSAALQYIAPYAGCALGEYFMDQGRDVLIVYDDLSKHAVAYRELSLLLERSPGREAYPGDVFYLHSRLLERAAHLSDEKGGGSMTALPIVETQAGDVSAYIPTNIISITDGQLFLENELFFSGQRPAINVGLSVSRVGGDAQTRAMKKSAGALRLSLAQYREMEVFMQFSSDLDEGTKRQLQFGQGLMYLLRQPQHSPMPQHKQVLLLIAGLGHVMQELLPEEIAGFREGLTAYAEQHAGDICRLIDQTGELSEPDRRKLLELSQEYRKQFAAQREGR